MRSETWRPVPMTTWESTSLPRCCWPACGRTCVAARPPATSGPATGRLLDGYEELCGQRERRMGRAATPGVPTSDSAGAILRGEPSRVGPAGGNDVAGRLQSHGGHE